MPVLPDGSIESIEAIVVTPAVQLVPSAEIAMPVLPNGSIESLEAIVVMPAVQLVPSAETTTPISSVDSIESIEAVVATPAVNAVPSAETTMPVPYDRSIESIEPQVATLEAHALPSAESMMPVPSNGSIESESRQRRRSSRYEGVAPPVPTIQKNPPVSEPNIHVSKGKLAGEVPANLRLHIIPDRHGALRMSGLIANRQREMPTEVSVTSALGEFSLVQFDVTRFETLTIPDLGSALCNGIELIAKGPKESWRWILSKRPLFVLIKGEEIGTSGYLSVPRLLVGEEHMVLVRDQLFAQTLWELEQAGCESGNFSEIAKHPFPGWRLLRGVEPTRAVSQVSDTDIFNALRPVAQVRPHFIGGIRIGKRIWLVGDPPHIRFTGVLPPDFAVVIDGKLASLTEAGFYESENWDAVGRHRVWFADQSINYMIIHPPSDWTVWRANDFGFGAAICGGLVQSCTVSQFGVTIPAGNTLLIGPTPGQVCLYNHNRDLHPDSIYAWMKFEPVWALPADPAHCNKSIACVLLVGQPREPNTSIQTPIKRRDLHALQRWCNAILDAGRKRLNPCSENEGVVRLWLEYRKAARILWRRLR